jgi:hypothetical protein
MPPFYFPPIHSSARRSSSEKLQKENLQSSDVRVVIAGNTLSCGSVGCCVIHNQRERMPCVCWFSFAIRARSSRQNLHIQLLSHAKILAASLKLPLSKSLALDVDLLVRR